MPFKFPPSLSTTISEVIFFFHQGQGGGGEFSGGDGLWVARHGFGGG